MSKQTPAFAVTPNAWRLFRFACYLHTATEEGRAVRFPARLAAVVDRGMEESSPDDTAPEAGVMIRATLAPNYRALRDAAKTHYRTVAEQCAVAFEAGVPYWAGSIGEMMRPLPLDTYRAVPRDEDTAGTVAAGIAAMQALGEPPVIAYAPATARRRALDLPKEVRHAVCLAASDAFPDVRRSNPADMQRDLRAVVDAAVAYGRGEPGDDMPWPDYEDALQGLHDTGKLRMKGGPGEPRRYSLA